MGLIKKIILGAILPGGTAGTGTVKGASFGQKLGQSALYQVKGLSPWEKLKRQYELSKSEPEIQTKTNEDDQFSKFNAGLSRTEDQPVLGWGNVKRFGHSRQIT